MTCIVGVAAKGKVWMGGDSCGSNEETWQVVPEPKVFERAGMLIGACGSFRLIDLLKYTWEIPDYPVGMDYDRYMRTSFIKSLEALEFGKELPGDILVGYAGKLYHILTDYAVVGAPNWGMAIGTGGYSARGSLYTTRKGSMTPRLRVLTALEASSNVEMGVTPPFTVLSS